MSTSEKSAPRRSMTAIFTTFAVVLFLGGFYIAGSIFLAAQPWYFRLLAVVVALVASIGCLMLTDYWIKIVQLVRGARIEMRKVVWPKKDELVKSTLMVLVIVAVFSLFLTIIDALLTLLIKWVL